MQTYGIGINDKRRDEMIKFEEESGHFSQKAYLDTEGLPTIGWGNRFHLDGREVKMGDTITRGEADQLYRQEVTRHVKAVRATPNYNKFNPNQQAAIESAVYNFGPNVLTSRGYETLARAIKAGDAQGVAKALPMYNNGGVLSARRSRELAVFNTPWEDPQKPPKVTSAQLRSDKNKPKQNQIVNGLKIISPILGNIPKLLKIK